MAIENPWLMPQGISDTLPEETFRLEKLRRELLDLFQSWGYQQVMPPFIEFLDSLLADLGKDLDLQTFKLTDQLSGKTMGVRADMTPQVARIDAHILNRDVPVRLSYIGTVLHSRNDEFDSSRSPLQVGCELFGHTGVASDQEIIRLMLSTLAKVGIDSVTLDVGHVGVFNGLMRYCDLDQSQEATLFDILQRKSIPDLHLWMSRQDLSDTQANMLQALVGLHGDELVLDQAAEALAAAGQDVVDALQYTHQTISALKAIHPELRVHIDFAELHGYHYKTGLVFAAYESNTGQELARGGRYDNIGEAYGRARPATGFSADLKVLSRVSKKDVDWPKGILAPTEQDNELVQVIHTLRQQGEVVVADLNDTTVAPEDLGCDRKLVNENGKWQVVSI